MGYHLYVVVGTGVGLFTGNLMYLLLYLLYLFVRPPRETVSMSLSLTDQDYLTRLHRLGKPARGVIAEAVRIHAEKAVRPLGLEKPGGIVTRTFSLARVDLDYIYTTAERRQQSRSEVLREALVLFRQSANAPQVTITANIKRGAPNLAKPENRDAGMNEIRELARKASERTDFPVEARLTFAQIDARLSRIQ